MKAILVFLFSEMTNKEATKYGVMTNNKFWKKLKPFLTNKGCFSE